MNSSELFCSVSTNGELVALCAPDGVVKFYDTLTSSLRQEYSSSTHLQAGCTCLSWSRHRKKTVLKQKKAKTGNNSANIENELNNLDLIAIGTSQGAVLLFSLSKGSLHSQLSTDGHSDKVNDICWDPQFKDSLFSCSDDGFIVEWSLLDAKMRTKWKASKTAITALSLEPTSKYLLTASKTITVWDLETKTKYKSLTGHSNDIFQMIFLFNKNVFLSTAVNDRIINSWNLDLSAKNKNLISSASISFMVNEEPIYIDAVTTAASLSQDDESASLHALICAVSNKGHLFIYNHAIDAEKPGCNKVKKPVKSVHQVQIETHEGNSLSIYGAFVMNEANERSEHFDQSQIGQLVLCIIYGSMIAPKIEKIEFSSLTAPKTVLRRADPSKIDLSLQTQSTKIETPSVSKDLKVLVPGFMAPQTSNALTASNAASKRKSIEPNQMSLEERLNVMGIESSTGTETDELYSKQIQQIPKTDNLLVLLVQGLQSNDAKMLNHVLQHQNEKVVTKTVRMLPTNHVMSLVKELNKRLQGHAQSGMGIIKWLKCVLLIHTSYLMSYPDLIDSLGSVYEMMNARTRLFPQLSKLQGKLQLVMTQVSSQAESLQANDKESQALIYYQDSNSEDEQVEEELIPSHSEFDDYLFSDEDEDEDLENDIEEMKDFNK